MSHYKSQFHFTHWQKDTKQLAIRNYCSYLKRSQTPSNGYNSDIHSAIVFTFVVSEISTYIHRQVGAVLQNFVRYFGARRMPAALFETTKTCKLRQFSLNVYVGPCGSQTHTNTHTGTATEKSWLLTMSPKPIQTTVRRVSSQIELWSPNTSPYRLRVGR